MRYPTTIAETAVSFLTAADGFVPAVSYEWVGPLLVQLVDWGWWVGWIGMALLMGKVLFGFSFTRMTRTSIDNPRGIRQAAAWGLGILFYGALGGLVYWGTGAL